MVSGVMDIFKKTVTKAIDLISDTLGVEVFDRYSSPTRNGEKRVSKKSDWSPVSRKQVKPNRPLYSMDRRSQSPYNDFEHSVQIPSPLRNGTNSEREAYPEYNQRK